MIHIVLSYYVTRSVRLQNGAQFINETHLKGVGKSPFDLKQKNRLCNSAVHIKTFLVLPHIMQQLQSFGRVNVYTVQANA